MEIAMVTRLTVTLEEEEYKFLNQAGEDALFEEDIFHEIYALKDVANLITEKSDLLMDYSEKCRAEMKKLTNICAAMHNPQIELVFVGI